MKALCKAFSLIELLVVIGIIAMLMSVIGVAAGRVRLVGRNMQQAATIHAMSVGLELFEKDFGFYPASERLIFGSGYVDGAQQLAEGLVGRDSAGVEKTSGFYVYNKEAAEIAAPDSTYYDSEEQKSLNNRKGPYFDLNRQGINAVEVSQLYDDTGQLYTVNYDTATNYLRAPVFADCYRMKKITDENGRVFKAGSPILYFRYNNAGKYFKEIDSDWEAMDEDACKDSYYNYYDNYDFFNLECLRIDNIDKTHRFQDGDADGNGISGKTEFYEFITSRTVGGYDMCTNRGTFIIISAGNDGLYGTKDDITNFDN
jgi:prepilin-type N-terminal cleavage/methylation domain-containing protein